MKKIFAIFLSLTIILLCGCEVKQSENTSSTPNTSSKTISVIQGQKRSGLMHCFNTIMTLANIDEAGNFSYTSKGIDKDNTNAIINAVASDKNAIGYTLLCRTNDTVKTISIDDVKPTKKSIENGTYPYIVPFNVITSPKNENPVAKDFVSWVFSASAASIVKEYGAFPIADGTEYTFSGASGTIKVITSSSWAPLVNKLVDEYKKINTSCTASVTEYDSETGVLFMTDGSADVSFITRELFETENAKGAEAMGLAYDGLVMIVNKKNSTKDLSQADLISIYSGAKTEW